MSLCWARHANTISKQRLIGRAAFALPSVAIEGLTIIAGNTISSIIVRIPGGAGALLIRSIKHQVTRAAETGFPGSSPESAS